VLVLVPGLVVPGLVVGADGACDSVTEGKLSLTPTFPGGDNVLDLSFDENDGREFSLILFSFSKECRMRESSSIRAHSGPPGTSNEAGWARLRGLSRWPQCPPAASTVQSQATEQEESSILSWSHTPHASRHTWTGRLSGGRRKSYSQRLRRRRWKAYRLSDASAGCPPCAGQHFFQAPRQAPCIQGQESLLLWANSEPGMDTEPA